MKNSLLIVLLTAVGIGMTAPAHAAADHEDEVLPARVDVFVLVGLMLENPIGFCREEPCGAGETSPAEPLFNMSRFPLGLTWGAFQSVSATSRVKCVADGSTVIRLRLRGLIPDGMYSIFYRTFAPDSLNPFCRNEERSVLVPDARPPQTCPPAAPDSQVIADAEGKASFRGRVPCQCLLDAGTVLIDVIYHFDGQTYGALPNRLEFESRIPPCSDDDNCRLDEECVEGNCQLLNCAANGTCRTCSSSFGRDAMRQAAIIQQQP